MRIIYNSLTGFTKKYAELIAEGLDLKAENLGEVDLNNIGEEEVIFLSWVRADSIVKFKKVYNLNLLAICAVGINPISKKYKKRVCEANNLDDANSFYLAGGIDIPNLRGINKIIMKAVLKSKLKIHNPNLTDEEFKIAINNRQDFVSKEEANKIVTHIQNLIKTNSN